MDGRLRAGQRRRFLVIALVIYWLGLFVLTHMPIPHAVYRLQLSDKVLHILTYMILTFLTWYGLYPYERVRWRRAKVWLILVVVVWYGVLDEMLQGYVGRNASLYDFLADLAGALAGLTVLTIFEFWAGGLFVWGTVLFGATYLSRAKLDEIFPVGYGLFHLVGYAVFCVLWVEYLRRASRRPVESAFKRVVVCLAVPLGLLSAVKMLSGVVGNSIAPADVLFGAAGVGAVAGSYGFAAFLRDRKPGSRQAAI